MSQELNYKHLYYFWVTAKEGGMSHAAARLGMAVQTVSAQVRALEQSLGHALFKPAGRGLALTDAGQAALPLAEQIFQLGEQFVPARTVVWAAGVAASPLGATLDVDASLQPLRLNDLLPEGSGTLSGTVPRTISALDHSNWSIFATSKALAKFPPWGSVGQASPGG